MNLFRAQPRYPVEADSIGHDDNPPTILPYRNLPNAYEVTALGKTESTNPSASWSRGPLVRAANPILADDLALPPPTPMYDRTAGPPEYWRP